MKNGRTLFFGERTLFFGVLIAFLTGLLAMYLMISPEVSRQEIEIKGLNSELEFANRGSEALYSYATNAIGRMIMNYNEGLPLMTNMPTKPIVSR